MTLVREHSQETRSVHPTVNRNSPTNISFGLHSKRIPASLTGSFEQPRWFFKGLRSK
jgi:hypothetical protein